MEEQCARLMGYMDFDNNISKSNELIWMLKKQLINIVRIIFEDKTELRDKVPVPLSSPLSSQTLLFHSCRHSQIPAGILQRLPSEA